jgi:flagellar hook-basal body complex protein FliE
MTSIERVLSSTGANQTEKVSAQNTEQGIFGDIFQSAIENVKQTEAEKNEAEYLLATGQLDNPALLTIASTKNQIAVELLVQLRNKALEAYQEITRISL